MTRPIYDYNKNWDVYTLEKNPKDEIIVGVSSGSTPSTRSLELWGGEHPWLTPKEITSEFSPRYKINTERMISDKGLKKSGGLLPINTVMMSKRAPVGYPILNSIPMATNQGFMNFQCGTKLLPEFLYYWIKCNRLYLERIANGSTYDELYSYDLFEAQIGIPSIKEQEKIISFLNSLEDQIQHLIATNKLLDGYQKSFFDKLFPSVFDETLFSSKSKLKKKELKELCMFVTDGAHYSPKEFLDGTKRIATVKNMRDFEIDLKNCKTISDEDYLQLVKNNCKPEKYDILISKDGTMGVIHLFNGAQNLVLLSSIAFLRVKDDFSYYYLKNYLSHEIVQSELLSGFSSGSVLTRIILDDLKKFMVLIPSDKLRIQFDQISNPINEMIFLNMNKIDSLKAFFETTLPKLIYGIILLK